jgi:HK97 family phage major capsid protein
MSDKQALDSVVAKIEGIESAMTAYFKKAEEEKENSGSVAAETKSQLDKLGEMQAELAQELLEIRQKGVPMAGGSAAPKTVGSEFTQSDQYAAFIGGQSSKCRMEVKAATLLGGDSTVAPDRKTAIVPGDFEYLTLENVFPHSPTSSNAIEYTKESGFTNSAAEAAEGAEKGESIPTFALATMPVSTVAHWMRISKQLASDAPALAAYVNSRMIYGVNQRVERQLGAGDGVAPNISGILDAGNFTAHGYAAAALGTLAKVNLVTKIMGDLWAVGARPDAILLNPADWAQILVDITDSSTNAVRINWVNGTQPLLHGVPVVQSNGITADNIAIGAFRQAGTIHDREDVVVEMSDSDDDNFTKNMITVRAERRVCLTIERPSYIIAGDLTPV